MANFDPNQPRDKSGEWSNTGAGGAPAKTDGGAKADPQSAHDRAFAAELKRYASGNMININGSLIDSGELAYLFNSSQGATSDDSLHGRMLYASKWYHRAHPDVPEVRAYKAIPIATYGGSYTDASVMGGRTGRSSIRRAPVPHGRASLPKHFR